MRLVLLLFAFSLDYECNILHCQDQGGNLPSSLPATNLEGQRSARVCRFSERCFQGWRQAWKQMATVLQFSKMQHAKLSFHSYPHKWSLIRTIIFGRTDCIQFSDFISILYLLKVLLVAQTNWHSHTPDATVGQWDTKYQRDRLIL